ncbi:MAG TPA: response regulator [Thermoanaerobaculia bacterium]|jgi:DNA-binding response OmpR family regulator
MLRDEKRVLVVDDDDAIRALLFTILRRRGFHVDVARNGVDALEHCSRCLYAVVVLDLMMPLMSGWAVLDRLAEMPIDSRPVVLVLTAGLEARHFDSALVAATIRKPFDIDLIVEAVTGCINSRSASDQLDGCPPADSERRPSSSEARPEKAN